MAAPEDPFSDPAFVAGLRPIPAGPVGPGPRPPAVDVVGVGPDGRPLAVRLASVRAPLLLAFLHTDCHGCDQYWTGLRHGGTTGLSPEVRPVIVTKGPGSVAVAEVAALAERITAAPVVMSDATWADYRVSGYPFFVLVDPGTRSVVGETVGFGWEDVGAMVRASLAGLAPPA